MSENPSTLTSIDAYDLFVDPQFLASHPKNSFTVAPAKRLINPPGKQSNHTYMAIYFKKDAVVAANSGTDAAR
jgi:hypothetical protein